MTQFMSLSLLRMRKQAKELAYPPPLEEKSSVKLFQEAVHHPRGTLGYAHHLERQKYHLSMILKLLFLTFPWIFPPLLTKVNRKNLFLLLSTIKTCNIKTLPLTNLKKVA